MNDGVGGEQPVLENVPERKAPSATSGLLELFDSPIDGFRNGACLDLRVRIALDLLAHSPMFSGSGSVWPANDPTVLAAEKAHAKNLAAFALDVATGLIEVANARGLIRTLDDSRNMEELQKNAERQVEFSRMGMKAQQRAQDQSLAVGRHVSGALSRN